MMLGPRDRRAHMHTHTHTHIVVCCTVGYGSIHIPYAALENSISRIKGASKQTAAVYQLRKHTHTQNECSPPSSPLWPCSFSPSGYERRPCCHPHQQHLTCIQWADLRNKKCNVRIHMHHTQKGRERASKQTRECRSSSSSSPPPPLIMIPVN